MISIQLPLPPSTNRLWRRAGARIIKSKEYSAWITEAGWRLKEQRPGSIRGPVELSYRMSYRIGKTRRDLGNLEKAATDLLVLHGVIEDDGPSIVRRINLALDASVDGCVVTVRPHAEKRASAIVGEIIHGGEA